MKTAKDAFLVKEWLAADADDRQVGDASLSDGVSCDDEGCVVQMAGGRLIALSLKPDGLADDCARAALIVTARPVASTCEATVIELKRLRAQGAMALRRTRSGFTVEAVKPRGVNRPWAPSPPISRRKLNPLREATLRVRSTPRRPRPICYPTTKGSIARRSEPARRPCPAEAPLPKFASSCRDP
jgi:competence protein ComEC